VFRLAHARTIVAKAGQALAAGDLLVWDVRLNPATALTAEYDG
jgi:hypothetical protein